MPNPDSIIGQAADIVADYFGATAEQVKGYSPNNLTRKTWNRLRDMNPHEAANEGIVYIKQYGQQQYEQWVNDNMLRDYEEEGRG